MKIPSNRGTCPTINANPNVSSNPDPNPGSIPNPNLNPNVDDLENLQITLKRVQSIQAAFHLLPNPNQT
jgi:hypothetical protein